MKQSMRRVSHVLKERTSQDNAKKNVKTALQEHGPVKGAQKLEKIVKMPVQHKANKKAVT